MSSWSEHLDAMVKKTVAPPAFARLLKLPYLDGWEPGRVWYEWKVDDGLLQSHGTVFGGYLAALADHTVTFAALTCLPDGASIVTASLNMTYLRPIRTGTLRVEGRVQHSGRQLLRAEALFFLEDGSLAVRADATLPVVTIPQSASPRVAAPHVANSTGAV
jgi:uncharacterized protein (TIGR00369 family)